MAARSLPGKPPPTVYLTCNCGLFRSLFGSPHALRQGRHEIGHGGNRFRGRVALGIEAGGQGIDQRRADHRTVGVLDRKSVV